MYIVLCTPAVCNWREGEKGGKERGGVPGWPDAAATTGQKANRRAICMTRGSPANVVMLPTLPELRFVFGRPNIGVLVRLKTSQRNWRLMASWMAKSRMSEKSKTVACGPRRMLAPALPNCPFTGNAKALVPFGA